MPLLQTRHTHEIQGDSLKGEGTPRVVGQIREKKKELGHKEVDQKDAQLRTDSSHMSGTLSMETRTGVVTTNLDVE